MCLIAVAWNAVDGIPLLVASNRDEFHARDTAALAFWTDAPSICGGRDAVAGGTWMALSRAGRFAAVTNFREGVSAADPNLRSRGELVSNFLDSDLPAGEWMQALLDGDASYGGFNLLAGTLGDRLYYCSNRAEGIRTLDDGLHSLSNGRLDADWPKQAGLRTELQAMLANRQSETGRVFELLADRSCPPDHQLPATGVGIEMERLLGPRFIVSPDYGTRCSTVVSSDTKQICITERRFGPSGDMLGESGLRFDYRTSF